jgi:5,10-methylenetetrahydromethanopterin reductase
VKFGANPYFDLLGRFKPRRKKIPIYMAAMGPKMLQLAGEIADGVLFSVGTPPSYQKYAIENIKIGAARTKRKISEIDLACYVACAPSNRRIAPTAVRGFISFMVAYASENVLRLINIDPADAMKIRETLETNGMLAASKQVSTEMIGSLMAYGKGEQIRERIEEYVSYGLHLPILLPLPPNFSKSIEIGATYARS